MPLRNVAALVLAAFVAAPAFGQQLVTTSYGPFSITSTSGTQLSNQLFTINVATQGTLQVQYSASPGHCSDVRAHILVDGVERAVTAFLGPGQLSGFFDVGPVPPGTHVVALQGEGRVGGCNSGALVGWGGTAQVVTSLTSAAEIPGPGGLATLLVFVAGAWWFGPWRQRKAGRRGG